MLEGKLNKIDGCTENFSKKLEYINKETKGQLETGMPTIPVTKKSVPIEQRKNTGFLTSKTGCRKKYPQ